MKNLKVRILIGVTFIWLLIPQNLRGEDKFQCPASTQLKTKDLLVADFNGDKKMDKIVYLECQNSENQKLAERIEVQINGAPRSIEILGQNQNTSSTGIKSTASSFEIAKTFDTYTIVNEVRGSEMDLSGSRSLLIATSEVRELFTYSSVDRIAKPINKSKSLFSIWADKGSQNIRSNGKAINFEALTKKLKCKKSQEPVLEFPFDTKQKVMAEGIPSCGAKL